MLQFGIEAKIGAGRTYLDSFNWIFIYHLCLSCSKKKEASESTEPTELSTLRLELAHIQHAELPVCHLWGKHTSQTSTSWNTVLIYTQHDVLVLKCRFIGSVGYPFKFA